MSFSNTIFIDNKFAVEVRRFIVESEPDTTDTTEPPVEPPVEPPEPPTEILCGDVFVRAKSLVIIPFSNTRYKGALV